MDYFKIRGKISGIRYPAIVDIKYDGMPVKVTYQAGMPLQVTTEAGISYCLPHLTNHGITCNYNGQFLAEWIHGDGSNNSIWRLLSAIPKNLTSTTIKIFDVINKDNEDFSQKSLIDRQKMRNSLINPQFCTKSWNVRNLTEVLTISQDVHDQGYEGLVIKNLHESLPMQAWVKLKPPTLVDLMVIKVDAARMEVNHNGVKVGVNLPGFQVNVGDLVKIKHYGITANGSLRNAVCVKKIL